MVAKSALLRGLVSGMVQGAECNPVEALFLGAVTNAPLGRFTKVHSLAWEFAMRPTMVSLLTLLLLAGSHPRVQVPGAVDPTDPKVRVLNIDGVRYELLLPPNAKMLAGSVTISSSVICDHAKSKD